MITIVPEMNVRPLIVRELRAESRRTSNYWLRALAAGLLTALFVWSVWSFRGDPGSLGLFLFSMLSTGMVLGVLIIVSALSADSISREKREGTLGLLFLTPLGSRDIVIGKALLHILRAVSIFLAMLPIIGLPFLLGGIPFAQVMGFFISLAIALVVAVSAGIIASVNTTEWIQSIVWALLICAGFLAACAFVPYLFAASQRFLPPIWFKRVEFLITTQLFATLLSISLLVFALIHSGRRLAATWQTEAGERRDPFWERFFAQSEFWQAAFRWDTRKARDRNPIAWLQEYNWASRLTKWGWCIILFAAQIVLFLAQMQSMVQFRRYLDYQMQLYILMALGIAFSAAASFRRERQTGALELLLVTPITAQQLIWGRLQGVWFHFFPAMAIMACVWCMGPQWISLPWRYLFYLVGAYFCIPVIGFYCSLLTSNVLFAWLLTLFFSLLLPYAFTQAFYFDIGRRNIPVAVFAIQTLVAGVATYLLFDNLNTRKFALNR
jgi:ABC-type transport system involved in multi-copper enzyme maturation permease subunit